MLRVPALYNQLLASLARRLAETTARKTSSTRIAAARTITLLPAGQHGVPVQFFDRFRATFAGLGKCLFLTYADVKERFPKLNLENPSVINWLNAIESEYDLIVYVADDKPTDWTRKAIRQADQLVCIVFSLAARSVSWRAAAADTVRPTLASSKLFESGALSLTSWAVPVLGRQFWEGSPSSSRLRSLIWLWRISSSPAAGSNVGRFPDTRC